MPAELTILLALAGLALLGWLVLRIEGALRLLDRSADSLSVRLDAGLQQANGTFGDVLQRLAVIDEAQRRMDALTREVIGLEALLGDKRARGALGEVQLQGLVSNVLPPACYDFQVTLSTGVRVDCLLRLPAPTGNLAVDAKFPLENYRRSIAPEGSAAEREEARKRLRSDVRLHIDAIAAKYIIPGETSTGAVMFIPAESLFAEIHGTHADLIDYAHRREVWLASPTTLFAILHTAAGLIKDLRTRAAADQIRVELGRLRQDFDRFEQRLGNLARHHAQAGTDLESLLTSGRQLLKRFAQIEATAPDVPPGHPQAIAGKRDEGA